MLTKGASSVVGFMCFEVCLQSGQDIWGAPRNDGTEIRPEGNMYGSRFIDHVAIHSWRSDVCRFECKSSAAVLLKTLVDAFTPPIILLKPNPAFVE